MRTRRKTTITQTNRNPYWKILTKLKHKIVLDKKGRRSYSRKMKHNKEKNND